MEYLQTWKVMESMVAAGKTKAIGVSNFTVEQLEQVRDAPTPPTKPPIRYYHFAWTSPSGLRLWVCVGLQLRTDVDERALSGVASVQPAVNQVELHPYFQQAKMLEYCDANKLVVMGYSPMGSSFDRYPEAHGTTLLKHPARSPPASPPPARAFAS